MRGSSAAPVGRGRDGRPRPPLFGRSELLGEVEQGLDDIAGARGQALILVGRDGSGKSAVLEEAARRAEDRGFRVVRARALPFETVEPFHLVRTLVDEAFPGEEFLRAQDRPPEANAGTESSSDL